MIGVVTAVPAGVIRWCRGGWDLGRRSAATTASAKLRRSCGTGGTSIAHVVRDRLESHSDQLIKNTADGDGRGRVKQSLPQDRASWQVLRCSLQRSYCSFSVPDQRQGRNADSFANQVNAGNVIMLEVLWNDALKSADLPCRQL
jgi:hypothetical protein